MIYIVEDEQGIRDLIIYTLQSVGFSAKGFEKGEEFFACALTDPPDLVILDIMLPEMDGYAILKKIRETPILEDIPVMLSTAKGSEFDKVIGLDLGADDYLVKPFGMMEMVSRVKALMRRYRTKQDTKVLKVGTLELNKDKHLVSIDGKSITLTLKEFEILNLFMSRLQMVFTRDYLLENVWGLDFVGESRTVDVHIGTLRQKLGQYGELIETVRGIGYKMNPLGEKNEK